MKNSLFFLVLFLCFRLAFAQPAAIDGSFTTTAQARIDAIATQADGKVILSGIIQNGIVRVTSTGTVDPTFAVGTGFNAVAYALAIQSDGKILVAGDFTTFNGTNCTRLARLLTSGGIDPTFVGTSSSLVIKLVVQPDGKILVMTGKQLYRLNANGSVDATFSAVIGLEDYTFSGCDFKLLPSGKILASRNHPTPSLFQLNSNGTVDATFNPGGSGPNSQLKTIEIQADNKILIGGSFTSYNNVGRNRIARLNVDGTLDATYNPGSGFTNGGFGCSVTQLRRQANNQMVASHTCPIFNGVNFGYRKISRINTNATLDDSFDPGSGFFFDGELSTLHLRPNEGILCGGSFTFYNGTSAAYLVSLKNDGSGMIPDGNQSIANGCTPNPIVLSGPISGSTFQWYSRVGVITNPPVVNSVAGWSAIPGASSSSYAPGSLTSSTSYACRVTRNARTNWAFGVRAITVAYEAKGSIKNGDQTLPSPANPDNIVLSTLPTHNMESTYQWYYKDGAAAQPTGTSTAGWTLIPDGIVRNYDPPAGLTVSRSYALLVTYNYSAACSSVGWALGVRKITVTTGATSPGVIANGNETLCYGGDPALIDFSTPATGPSLTYQWYSKDGIITPPTGTSTVGWGFIGGATASSYNPPSGAPRTVTYACIVKSGATDLGWASGARQITVLPIFDAGTVTAGDQSLCANGNPANITLSTNPTGSGAYTYRWYYKEAVVACPAAADGTAGWLASAGTSNSYDPQSAGVNGRTFALRVTPAGIPTCSVPAWAGGCRKITVIPCRSAMNQELIPDQVESSPSLQGALLGNIPNPASDQTVISCFIPFSSQMAEIRILNSLGREVDRILIKETGNQEITLPLTKYPNGLFTYSLMVNSKMEASQRMVVIK